MRFREGCFTYNKQRSLCEETEVDLDQVIYSEKTKAIQIAVAKEAALKGLYGELDTTEDEKQLICCLKSIMIKQET